MHLAPAKRRQIVAAHLSGFNMRTIAQLVGVSQGTVQRALNGHFGRGWRDKRKADRCPGCGGLVYLWPCMECVRRSSSIRRAMIAG